MTDLGKTPQSLFFHGEHRPLELNNLYRDSSAFLVLNGPSHRKLDLDRLRTPGLLTMCINNGCRSFRPDLWLTCDIPGRFLPSIWTDPRILKFARAHHLGRPIRSLKPEDSSDPRRRLAKDCPNVVWFEDSCRELNPATFLDHPKVVFGDRTVRSGMLAAFKVLYRLGVREVFLVGCDFHMRPEQPYGFFEPVSNRHVEKNNRNYTLLSDVLRDLQPHFLAHDFRVFNCNPASDLNAFPFVDFDDAVSRVTRPFKELQELEEHTSFYYQAVLPQAPTPNRSPPADPPKHDLKLTPTQAEEEEEAGQTTEHGAQSSEPDHRSPTSTASFETNPNKYPSSRLSTARRTAARTLPQSKPRQSLEAGQTIEHGAQSSEPDQQSLTPTASFETNPNKGLSSRLSTARRTAARTLPQSNTHVDPGRA